VRLFEDEGAFGAQREFLTALARQMVGKGDQALHVLKELCSSIDTTSIMYLKGGLLPKVFVEMLCGDFEAAELTAQSMNYILKSTALETTEAWNFYLGGNTALQRLHLNEAQDQFQQLHRFKGKINAWAYFDGIIGEVQLYFFMNHFATAQKKLNWAKTEIAELRYIGFPNVVESGSYKLKWLLGEQSSEMIKWALHSPQIVLNSTDILCTMEVPEITRAKILITTGRKNHIKRGIDLVQFLQSLLDSVNNHYHSVDLLMLMAIGNYRLSLKSEAIKILQESIELCEKKGLRRPLMEFSITFPDIFSLLDITLLPQGIQHILKNARLYDSDLVSEIATPLSGRNLLTRREIEILNLAAEGLRNKEIAQRANVSETTVKSHVSNIFRKLEVPNRTSMIKKAIDLKILD
jgi:DNA-binding CsgD family transcriptional regulator